MVPDGRDDADASHEESDGTVPDPSGQSAESESPAPDASGGPAENAPSTGTDEEPVPEESETGDGLDPEANGDSPAGEGELSCPECGERLPAAARFCPYCSTAIDEDGSAVDLSELDGDILEDPAELIQEDETGLRRASGRVRVVAGLAVSIPLAPLVLFLVGSATSLSVWTAALVFLAGWFGPAALLSRARVPAEAFGRSLYLIAVGTLLIPVVIEASGDVWRGAVTFDTVAVISLVIAGALIVLGTFVTGQARKRVTGERRDFDGPHED